MVATERQTAHQRKAGRRRSRYKWGSDPAFANRHRTSKHEPALPLYTTEDAERALAQVRPVDFGRRFTPAPGVDARFTPSGHILGAGLVLGLINAVVRPVLLILTLPLTLVTLGLFLLVLNALCLWLTSALVKGFTVHGFWAAFFGALIVSVVSWLLNAFLSDRGRLVVITHRER